MLWWKPFLMVHFFQASQIIPTYCQRDRGHPGWHSLWLGCQQGRRWQWSWWNIPTQRGGGILQFRGPAIEWCLDGTSTEHFHPHGTSTRWNVHLDISSFGYLDSKWTYCTSTPNMGKFWGQMSLSDILSDGHLIFSNCISTFGQPFCLCATFAQYFMNIVLTYIFWSKVGTRYFFLRPLPLVHYLEIVLPLRAGLLFSKIC